MRKLFLATLCLCSISVPAAILCRGLQPVAASSNQPPAALESATQPTYAADGSLIPPLNYRQWIYLTTGMNMSYTTKSADMDMFDNVFVNPEAWRGFAATGKWPDKTILVLESRGAASNGSINKSGHFQTGVMGLEVHVKDAARFPGGWAFFDVESESKATLIPATAPCYSCHQQHAAVDTTFVQFYPTLLPVAQKMGTLSPQYLKESALEKGH